MQKRRDRSPIFHRQADVIRARNVVHTSVRIHRRAADVHPEISKRNGPIVPEERDVPWAPQNVRPGLPDGRLAVIFDGLPSSPTTPAIAQELLTMSDQSSFTRRTFLAAGS